MERIIIKIGIIELEITAGLDNSVLGEDSDKTLIGEELRENRLHAEK